MTFQRESRRHPLIVRRLTVAAVAHVTPSMARVTLTSAELEGFASDGPADHVKVFFPDPATGVLTTPELAEGRINRPTTGVVISRDYTPLEFRALPGGRFELDIDFVLHGDNGPASAWAAAAVPGSPLGIAGPRGSRLIPADIDGLLIIADETALPSASRWIQLAPEHVAITALFDVADDSLEEYLAPGIRNRASIEWLPRTDGEGLLDEALRSLGPIDDRTFVFMAGESTTLVPLRRYLRRDLGLAAEQVSASGYWKRGIVNLDHHAPLDPTDPD